MDKVIEGIIKEVADKHGVSFAEANRVFNEAYKFIRLTAESVDVKGMWYDELREVRSNFAMPSLFKMYLDRKRINEYMNSQIIKEEENE